MLRIKRSANGQVIFTLSGRIEMEQVAELQKLLETEGTDRRVVLDLKEVTLVDRDAIQFLAHCEADCIKLDNCPAYIREWIEVGRVRGVQRKR